MCILHTLKIWKRYGGKILFTFQPNFHMIVNANGRLLRGTNKKMVSGELKELDVVAFSKWFKRN